MSRGVPCSARVALALSRSIPRSEPRCPLLGVGNPVPLMLTDRQTFLHVFIEFDSVITAVGVSTERHVHV